MDGLLIFGDRYDRRLEAAILLVLAVIGLATRFYNIGVQDIGMDEGATYTLSQWSFSEIVDYGEPNSPTYYLLEGAIVDLFGNSNLSIKALSAVFGALCVVFTYLAARDMFKSRAPALVAAAMAVCSPLLMNYSQEARGFECAATMVMCQLWLFTNALDKKDDTKIWLLFGVVSAVGVHLQYVALMPTALFYFIALLYFRVWRPKEIAVFRPFWSFLLMLALILPVVPSVLNTFETAMNYTDTWDSGWQYLRNTLIAFFYQKEWFAQVCTVLLGLGEVMAFFRHRRDTVIMLAVSVIPILFTLWVSMFSHVHYRYVLFSAPIFYILISYPLTLLEDRPKISVPAVAACAVVLLCVAAPTLQDYYDSSQRGDMRGLVDILEDETQDGDCIVYTPEWLWWGIGGCLSFYYDQEADGTTILSTDSAERLNDIISDDRYGNVFLITWDFDNEVTEWAKSGGETTELFRTSSLTLYEID